MFKWLKNKFRKKNTVAFNSHGAHARKRGITESVPYVESVRDDSMDTTVADVVSTMMILDALSHEDNRNNVSDNSDNSSSYSDSYSSYSDSSSSSFD